jgi:glycosyltransferase involved in cell wall biosynthesis
MSPAISVIMPVHNGERYLDESLDSVLAQTFSDFTLIAIDDGSTDRSLQILRGYAQRDRRMSVLSRGQRGLVFTLNEGLARATAPFVARMDHDDVCHSRRFERQIAVLQRQPEIVALGSFVDTIDEHGRYLGEYSAPLTHQEIEASHLRGDSAIHHPSVMMRTAAIRRAGGYRELVPCEDFDLWLRLGEIGQLANLPERLLRKRLHSASLVARTLSERREVLGQVLADAWSRRGLPGQPPCPTGRLRDSADLLRQWGWMALKAGQVGTSRRYAIKAIRSRPLAHEGWRLMACALRGR